MIAVHEAARQALAAGLSTVPPCQDGSKAPRGRWKQYQKRLPTEAELDGWYRQPLTGIGLVCGAVSGNLECLEFETRKIYTAYLEAAKDCGLGELVERIEAGYSERAPRGGVHWLYKCPEIAGNTKLARADKTTVLVETRGEGGYVIAAPSNGTVHPTGRPYVLLRGGFETIPTITVEERQALHELARTFDRVSRPQAGWRSRDTNRPGDEYNRTATWEELLEPLGWVRVFERNGATYWRRPGKACGISATTNHGGSDLLFVFSTSTEFDTERGYSKFAVYALTQHGGDFTMAAREAARLMGMERPAPSKALAEEPQGPPPVDDGYLENLMGEAAAREPEGAPPDDEDDWPDPQPLTAKIPPEPYPLVALPDTLQSAVKEVQGFVKAPLALVASSALSALSLAIQAYVDVKRLEKLQGPVGLFLLTIAESGERKTTCDNFFSRAISDYEEAQAEAAKPALKDYRAAIDAWETKRLGIKDRLRRLAKEEKSTTQAEKALCALEHNKPEPPRIPRLLYADATPEALAYGLAKQWPSAGVVSAEAGIVFGSHGMGKDSLMRNLALLNLLWDGKSLTIDRRTTESFTVRGARLTVALQIQEQALRSFFDKTGALARGTGFLARFLVAWPESTQGTRQIDPNAPDGPTTWPHLAAFHQRIAEILHQPTPINDDGTLAPPTLPLTPEAKAAWVDYHNAIERELASGGELYDVRDVASKSADNAARLAALFQWFEGGGGAVGLDSFNRASRIAAWHLHESRRFFGELALPVELADAARLDNWLIEYCQRERTHLVGKSVALQYGPLRKKDSIDAAIHELAGLDRLQVRKDGKRAMVAINPALLGFANAKVANPANDGNFAARISNFSKISVSKPSERGNGTIPNDLPTEGTI